MRSDFWGEFEDEGILFGIYRGSNISMALSFSSISLEFHLLVPSWEMRDGSRFESGWTDVITIECRETPHDFLVKN